MAKKLKGLSIAQILIGLLMIFIMFTIIVPLLNIVAISFSDPKLSQSMTGLQILPKGLSAINYQIIFSNPVIIPSIGTSVYITGIGTLINIVLTTFAAYALTRPNLYGKSVIMAFLILMMLFDPGLVPEYLVVRQLGLLGSKWSVILSTAVNVYYLIIMMRYFEDVPVSLYEAATIDGAGHFKTLWHIAAPLCKPGIATLTMFYGVVRWNEYVRSGVYITSLKGSPLQVVLRKFLVEGDTTSLIGAQNLLNYNELAQIDYRALTYATIVVAVVPILVCYPFVLKYYKKGIMEGGVKE